MAMTLGVSGVTETSASFALGSLAADGTIDLQISPRSSFAHCVAPCYSVARATAATVSGLNQRATLFARARARRADGTVEDWSAIRSFRTGDGTAQITTPAAVMIEPAMLFVPEKVTNWTPSTAVSGYPASNLGWDGPVAWKAVDGAGGQYVEAELSGAPIDTIAALNSNLPEAATVTITAAPTQAGLASGTGRVTLANGVAFRASANLPGRLGYHGLFRFAVTALPWWRVAFGGTKPADTLHLEHLLFGLNRSTKNHSIDKSETPMPKTTIERTRAGLPDRVTGLAMRKVEFEISMMTEAQYESAYGDLVYLENEPVFVLPNSKTGAFLHDRMLFGDLKGSRIYNPASPRFSRAFTVESII